MEPKPASASRVEVTHLVMPGDANSLGTAFGGMVMQWTDLAAGMAAMRHARLPVVTASLDQLSFLAPVRIGHMAILVAHVTAVFATSMEVNVEVSTEDPRTGERRRCCDAYLTFVALDDAGRPTRAPPLLTESEDERRREREARVRRASRLALRTALTGA
ncbi:acyl-CoA thioesterase [Anaeromyxobacter sp. Fw109-5]|uniref:acyl-CoA thioesterase n=1 Tax=Anaeromyxobacter sp. (strain Fw109-5) TaxID=404589 RepID=UPI0000ED805B|nr:acyl-CoA thioesterase [Anaeromyxobacter sp. Fw109-5]ABS25396.1 thioesterase superfamily protein [Anaeromyxobacter sp. Fw109-5]